MTSSSGDEREAARCEGEAVPGYRCGLASGHPGAHVAFLSADEPEPDDVDEDYEEVARVSQLLVDFDDNAGCYPSISLHVTAILAELSALRAEQAKDREDAELLDWIESVYVNGDELSIDRCELEPDGGGALFVGFAIYRGKKDDFASFVSGEESLRAALLAARATLPETGTNGE